MTNIAFRIRRLVATVLAGLLAAVVFGPSVSTAFSSDPEPAGHVNVTDNALDPNFVPVPGQHGLGEQTFLNEVREEGVTGSDRALLADRADTCTLIESGYGVDAVAGFWADHYGKRQAGALTLAAYGTCGGSVLAEQMP